MFLPIQPNFGGLVETFHLIIVGLYKILVIYNELTVSQIVDNYILPKLHMDLQPYLYGDELHHPFVSLVGGVYPRLYKRINKLYSYRIEQSKQYSSPNEWQSFLPHLPVHERISEFMRLEFERTDFPRETPQYFQLIGQIWTDPECLGQTLSFLELMLGISDRQPISENVHDMMTPTEKDKLAELPEEFIVFRGHAEPLLRGISWTINLDIALQYAIGSPHKSLISIGTARKSEVIAFIDRWNEDEIIIPSSLVDNIKTFKTFNDSEV
jgi:hypothetical protein